MTTRLLSNIGIAGIAALALTASNAAAADTRAETTTYVDGNLTGVSPNTGGTLLFSDDKAMYFRTGLSNVPVPYANISHTELGATKETSHDVPLYKVWALHKRLGKTETQLLIINFKNDAGEEKNMTLELAKSSAPVVLSTIQSHGVKNVVAENTVVAKAEPATNGEKPPKPSKADAKKTDPEKTAAKADSWWGDDYWKTSRNADKWNTKSGTSSNNDQR